MIWQNFTGCFTTHYDFLILTLGSTALNDWTGFHIHVIYALQNLKILLQNVQTKMWQCHIVTVCLKTLFNVGIFVFFHPVSFTARGLKAHSNSLTLLYRSSEFFSLHLEVKFCLSLILFYFNKKKTLQTQKMWHDNHICHLHFRIICNLKFIHFWGANFHFIFLTTGVLGSDSMVTLLSH